MQDDHPNRGSLKKIMDPSGFVQEKIQNKNPPLKHSYAPDREIRRVSNEKK